MDTTHYNVPLKMAMFASGKRQQNIAKAAKIDPAKLSHVVRGRREFTPNERRRIARVLGKSEAELFEATA